MKTTYTMDEMDEITEVAAPQKKFGENKKKRMSAEEFYLKIKEFCEQMENGNEYPNMKSAEDDQGPTTAEESSSTSGFVGENQKFESNENSSKSESSYTQKMRSDNETAANKAMENEGSADFEKKVRLAAAKLQVKKTLGKK